jgi:hypothetical protein
LLVRGGVADIDGSRQVDAVSIGEPVDQAGPRLPARAARICRVGTHGPVGDGARRPGRQLREPVLDVRCQQGTGGEPGLVRHHQNHGAVGGQSVQPVKHPGQRPHHVRGRPRDLVAVEGDQGAAEVEEVADHRVVGHDSTIVERGRQGKGAAVPRRESSERMIPGTDATGTISLRYVRDVRGDP